MLAAVLWLLLSGLFTLYVTFAGSYSRTYGTLAAGVILLLWLNYTAWAILFGAELNAELERRTLGAQLGAELLAPARARSRRAAGRRPRPTSVRSDDWNAKPSATDFLPAAIWSPR